MLAFIVNEKENRASWYYCTEDEAREALQAAEVTGSRVEILDPTLVEPLLVLGREGGLMGAVMRAWVQSRFSIRGVCLPLSAPGEYKVLDMHGDRVAAIDAGPLSVGHMGSIEIHCSQLRMMQREGYLRDAREGFLPENRIKRN